MAILEVMMGSMLASGISAASEKVAVGIGVRFAAGMAGSVATYAAAEGIQKGAEKRFQKKAEKMIENHEITSNKQIDDLYKKSMKKAAWGKALAGGAIGGVSAVAGEVANVAVMNKINNGSFSLATSSFSRPGMVTIENYKRL